MIAQVPLHRYLFSLSALHEASQPAQNAKDRRGEDPKTIFDCCEKIWADATKEGTLFQTRLTGQMERKEWEERKQWTTAKTPRTSDVEDCRGLPEDMLQGTFVPAAEPSRPGPVA